MIKYHAIYSFWMQIKKNIQAQVVEHQERPERNFFLHNQTLSKYKYTEKVSDIEMYNHT